MGICAGQYYLSQTIVWSGVQYTYLNLFLGTCTGPMSDLGGGSTYQTTTTHIDDATIGITNTDMTMLYYGGGYLTNLAASSATMVANYSYGGTASGQANGIRFTYGSGHVFLTGTHPEMRCGSTEDWSLWDNYVENSNTTLTSSNPWPYFSAIMDNWLAL